MNVKITIDTLRRDRRMEIATKTGYRRHSCGVKSIRARVNRTSHLRHQPVEGTGEVCGYARSGGSVKPHGSTADRHWNRGGSLESCGGSNTTLCYFFKESAKKYQQK